jgi:hypothetical protein
MNRISPKTEVPIFRPRGNDWVSGSVSIFFLIMIRERILIVDTMHLL